MRAWELQGFSLDELVLVERPVPEPGPREVLVRVRAAALNSRDLQVIHDQYDPDQHLPLVPVSDGAGEIVAVGEEVSRVVAGDRVVGAFAQGWVAGERTWERWLTHLGGHRDGLLQEYALLDAEGAVRVPGHLSDAEAAAATSAAATAWQALVVRGGIRAGQSVLVQGTGGVALFALQFALLAGADVFVTSASDEKLERARALGALAGINYRADPDWDERVLELTNGLGVDHVVETAGDLARSLNCLRVGGLVSCVGYLDQLELDSGEPPAWSYRVGIVPVLVKNARLHGMSAAPRETYEEIYRAMAAAELRPVVDRVFPFEEAVEALRYLKAGAHFGKVCVAVAAR
ncbi:MAG TPA: NAD(P)-dependent alcohol dehydrogenase [Gaiellaceae bacterium]|nr:NAD(P)-dependent alcohol dehydrogenase [Gaiellaceae bacterium]